MLFISHSIFEIKKHLFVFRGLIRLPKTQTTLTSPRGLQNSSNSAAPLAIKPAHLLTTLLCFFRKSCQITPISRLTLTSCQRRELSSDGVINHPHFQRRELSSDGVINDEIVEEEDEMNCNKSEIFEVQCLKLFITIFILPQYCNS